LFSITVNVTYGNTSLQIQLFPLWNTYSNYHTTDTIGNSRPIHRVTRTLLNSRHTDKRWRPLSADTVDRHFNCRVPTLTADRVADYSIW